ncbi:MAG: hypothetical protein QOJ07_293, partial [Thermoleophilaceae bacterium]|nr:hypothetical protein [Thermoleophilaceae bacterium]
ATGTGGAKTDDDTLDIAVNAVNDGPVNTVPGAQSLPEDGSHTFTGSGNQISVADVDASAGPVSTDLKVTSGKLTVGSTPGGLTVTGDGTGHVVLTGTPADVNSALDGLRYDPDANFFGDDTLTVKTDDQGHTGSGGPQTATSTVGLTVTSVDDAPTITAPSTTQTINEDSSKTFSAGGATEISVADVDAGSDDVKADLSATNGILTATPTTGLTVTGDGTKALSLTGSQAKVNAALDGLVYKPDDNYFGSDTIAIAVDDLNHNGSGGPLTATKNVAVSVTSVDDAPTLTQPDGALAYTEDVPTENVATAIAPNLAASDIDSANAQSATVKIASGYANGQDVLAYGGTLLTATLNAAGDTLTLSGTATIAQYQAELGKVTYANTSDDPSAATRTVEFRLTDSDNVTSDAATRAIDVTATNDAPAVHNSAGSASYSENDTTGVLVDPNVTVSDVDDANLEGATVQITTNRDSATDELLFAGYNGISVQSFTASTGTLVLTGHASKADYQTALQMIRFRANGDNPSGATRTVSFKVSDGDAESSADSRTVSVVPANDAPTVTTTSGNSHWTEGDPAAQVDGGLTVTDPDSTDLSKAEVEISSGTVQPGDVLSFTPSGSVTGNYDPATHILTLQGAADLATYQAVLRSVGFSNTTTTPGATTRRILFRATDSASATSTPDAEKDVTVTEVNSAPVVQTSSGSTSFVEDGVSPGSGPVAVDSGLGLTDADSPSLSSATVQITGNYASGEDVLTYTAPSGNPVTADAFDASNGKLVLHGPASPAEFQAALRAVKYDNSSDTPSTAARTIRFVAVDGSSVNSTSATGANSDKSLTVAAANDAPTVHTTSGSTAYTERAAAVTIDSGATITDPDSTQFSGASATIKTGKQTGDALTFDAPPSGITGQVNAGGDTVTFTGNGSRSDYETALHGVRFASTNHNPSAARTIAFTATDDASATSAEATKAIAISPVNDAPVITTSSGSTSYTENAAATPIDGALTVSDADSAQLQSATVTISNVKTGDVLSFTDTANIHAGAYDPGTGSITLTGPDTVTAFETALRNVKFSNTSDTPDSTDRSIAFQATDGSDASNVATKTLTVTPVNDAPVVTTSSGSATFNEDLGPVVVDPGVTVSDVDSTMLAGATASITANFNSAQDVLSFTPPAGSTITGSYASGSGVLTLTGSGTAQQYQDALQSVTYANTSQGPTTGTRTVSFQVSDGAAFNPLSTAKTRDVNVVGVNDAPVLGQSSTSTTFTENTTPTPAASDAISLAPDLTASDADSANLTGATVKITSGFKSAEDVLSYATTNGVSGSVNAAGDTVTLTGSHPVSDYQAALRAVTYRDSSNTPDPSDRTITFTADDGEATNNTSNALTRTLHVVPTADAPTPSADSYDGVGNTDLFVGESRPAGQAGKVVTGSLLTNDTDPDTAQSSLVTQSGTTSTSAGGSVTIASDGTFDYQPQAGDTSLTDTFTYTVCDTTPCDGSTPSNDKASATASVALAGQVWYVKNNAPASPTPDGTSARPFKALAQADTASGSGDTAFVFKGDGSQTGYNTGYTMASSERLLGEVNGLTIDPDGAGTLPTVTLYDPVANAYPNVSNLNADVVTLASGAELRGLTIDPTGTGGGIYGTGLGNSTVTIDNDRVADSGVGGTQAGLELSSDSTTTTNISSLTIDNGVATGTTSGSVGVLLSNAGKVNFASSGTISINTNGARGLDVLGTDMGSGSVFDDITVTNSGTGGVRIGSVAAPVTGTTTLGNGSGTDLDLTTTSGSAAAFELNTAGTVTVPGTGTANVRATGGPAVDITNTSGGTYDFDDVDSTNSAGDGINIDGLGTGTFTAASGDVGGYAGTAFDLNGGSGTVTYPGNFGNALSSSTTSKIADITGRTGGAVTFSGAINHTNGAGGGINVSGNSAGSTTFSNVTKNINTSQGAGDAVTIAQPDSSTHAVSFTNGGLNIDTGAGKGFEATGVGSTADGTVKVNGSGNTIDTHAGRALSLSSVGLEPATPLNFTSISSNGAPEGIRLTGTGSNPSLTVTGGGSVAQGGNGTGGTIQQSTNTGIYLSDTVSPSFNNMTIDTSGHGGITGSTGVHGISFTNGKIMNSGHKSGVTPVVNRDAAFDFTDLHGGSTPGDNLDGALTITNNSLSDNWGGNVHISNSGGTISNAVITGNATSNTPSDSTNASGVKIIMTNASGTVGSLTKANISNNNFVHPRGTGINVSGTSQDSAAPGTWGDPDSSTNVITIDSNVITGGTPDGVTNPAAISAFGIGVAGNGLGKVHADVTNNGNPANPILNTVGNGIGVGVAGNVRGLYKVTSNQIAPHNFGGAQGIGVEADKDGNGHNSPKLAADVRNNVTTATNGPGVWANMHSTNGSMFLNLQNNNFGAPTAADGLTPGIKISDGSTADPSFNPTICVDVESNTSGTAAADPTNPPYHDPGIDLYKRSSSASTYVFGITGLSPSPATAAQTQTYVSGLNPGSAFDNTSSTRALVVSGSNFTSCTLPIPLAPAP